MIKTIRIGQKDYVLSSSAYTSFKYKNETGMNLLTEIQNLSADIGKQTDIGNIVETTNKVLYMAYLMNMEYLKKEIPYEEWLKEIDDMFEDTKWIMDTLELALSPFRRNIPLQKQ